MLSPTDFPILIVLTKCPSKKRCKLFYSNGLQLHLFYLQKEDSPIFFGIVQTALIFEGLGVGLEIDQGARVLPEGQDFGYGGLTPFAGGVLALFAALTDALALPILCGGQDAVLLQQAGRGFDPLPLYAEPVNSADDLGGFIVNDPLPEIVRVFL